MAAPVLALAVADAPWLADAEAALPEASLRRIAWLSILTIAIGFGGFITWAALTRIESAVPASGAIVVDGKRKTISLQDNGLLRTLLVHEGDRVAAGQLLLRLDDVQARTAVNQANVLYWAAVARLGRLQAEAADAREMPVSDELRQAAQDPDVAAALQAEQHLFAVRWANMDGFVRVQQRKVAEQQAQASALRAQLVAISARLGFVQEELRSIDFLMARGLATRPRQLELLSNEADMRGQLGQLAGQLTQALETIAQINLETINAAEQRRSDMGKDRADTQAAQADAMQRLRAATDLLDKREITAPEAGIVTDIKYFTPGSSIIAGQPVMDLVPLSQRLLVESSVAPQEVEHLAVGQRVNIRLTAYKAHRVPVITGRLVYVGADRQLDANNAPFFLVRAEIDRDALRDKPGVVLLPGMSADVLILNGARTALDFFISPITDSIHRAMREE